MFNKEDYGKILVPMVTPFKDNQGQDVDYEAAVSIAKKLIEDNNADSLILSGTTGEFFTMTFEERVKLFKVMKEEVGEDIPLIAGTGCASTVETIRLSQKAEELGYELLMVVAPYYTKPNQAGIFTHFQRVAESINIPFMLYNIPIFTGVNIAPDTLKELVKIENIVGIKEEAELNAKQMTEYINATPEDIIVYNGDDTMVIESFAQGGDKRIGGVVSGGAHLIGGRIRNMIETFLEGNVAEAAELQQSFLPLYRIMGQNGRTNPVSLLKEAMKMVGYDAGIPRSPLLPGTEEEKARVKDELRRLDIL